MTNQLEALQLAEQLESIHTSPFSLPHMAAATIRTQHTRIAELEAMLDAVGAGGVGQSIKPQVQADTAQEPVAWRVRPFDYGIGHEGVDALTTRKEQCEMWERKGWKVEPLYAAPQPTENLHCKSTQKRLATLWGYEKASQPLTDTELEVIGRKHFGFPTPKPWYAAARELEAAASQPDRQPLTDEQILSIVRVAPALDTVEAEFLHIARAVEAAHGITGGQQ